MISFCQDLTISYEYHVYENKTIKKVSHKRNGSNISQKTFVKAPKLSVISKNPNQYYPQINKGIGLTQPQSKIPVQFKKKLKHQRTISNNSCRSVYTKKSQISQRLVTERQHDKTFNNLQLMEVKSIQLPQNTYRQRLKSNKIFQIQKLQNQPKNFNFFSQNHSPIRNIQSNLTKQYKIPSAHFSNKSLSQQNTIKIINQEEYLNQSIQTKKPQRNIEKQSSPYNHSRTSSFSCYEDKLRTNMSNGLLLSCYSQKQSLKVQNNPSNFINLINRPNEQTFQKSIFQNIEVINPQFQRSRRRQRDEIFNKNQKQQNGYITNNSPFNMNIKQYRNLNEDQHNQKHILYDAISIFSKSLKQQDGQDESLSVVQQRNFFFQKQQEPQQIFKKSIEKYIFFETGISSTDKKWMIFNNAQQKQSKKLYSIKQFPSLFSQQYMDQYQIYLSLKVQNSKQNGKKINKNFLLQLYTGLSNGSQKNLYLVKQPFKYLLSEYIQIQKKGDFTRDTSKSILVKKYNIESQIRQIFQYLKQNNIQIKECEHLLPEDFVVCEQPTGKIVIKFHSLFKLEMISTKNFQKYKNVEQKNQKSQHYPKNLSYFANGTQNISIKDHKGSQKTKIFQHQISNWCFYHTCQHNLKSYQKINRETSYIGSDHPKLIDLFKIIGKMMMDY